MNAIQGSSQCTIIDTQVAYAGNTKVWESSIDTNIEKEGLFEVWEIYIARANDGARVGSDVQSRNVKVPRQVEERRVLCARRVLTRTTIEIRMQYELFY